MPTTNNIFLSRVANFTGQNWATFTKDVENFFWLEGSWDIVNGSKPRPTDPAGAAEWDKANDRAYPMIYFLLDADYRGTIADVSTGAAAWAQLKREYQRDTPGLRLALRNDLYAVRHDPTKPVAVYIEAILTIAHRVGWN
jgi:hypothetical protein